MFLEVRIDSDFFTVFLCNSCQKHCWVLHRLHTANKLRNFDEFCTLPCAMRLALFSVITAHECDLNFGSWYFWNIWLRRARSFRLRALWMICITELGMASKNASALGAQAFSQLSSRRRGRISCNDPVMNAHSESNTELHCLCTSEMRNPTQMSGAHRLCWNVPVSSRGGHVYLLLPGQGSRR